MKVLVFFVGWCILFVLSWPLAVAVLVVAPFVWLLSLPFRFAGLCIAALFALVKRVLFLPARLFGYRS